MKEITKEKQGKNAIKWIKALLSGKYEQTASYLRSVGFRNKYAYCCWGVGRRVLDLSIKAKEPWDNDREKSDMLSEHVGFNNSTGDIRSCPIEYDNDRVYYSLGSANDDGVCFSAIAHHLIVNAHSLFNKEVATIIEKEFQSIKDNYERNH